jgi:hypothetical protein
MKTQSWKFVPVKHRSFIFCFHFQGFNSISLGIHFDLSMYNFELHLPFCFIRIGRDSIIEKCEHHEKVNNL